MPDRLPEPALPRRRQLRRLHLGKIGNPGSLGSDICTGFHIIDKKVDQYARMC